MEEQSSQSASSITAWVLGLILACCTCSGVMAQTAIPSRVISVNFEGIPLRTALETIAEKGEFQFSYDAAIMPDDTLVSATARDQIVAKVLPQILPEYIGYHASGNHLILYKKIKQRKTSYTLAGKVVQGNGRGIEAASIYLVGTHFSTQTDANGHFELEVKSNPENQSLKIAKTGFEDQLIHLKNSGEQSVVIQLKNAPIPKAPLKPVSIAANTDLHQIEALPLVRQIVPESQLQQALDFERLQEMGVQFSLIPSVGTNRALSGAMVNRLSFNLFAGYANGVNGVELGGMLNITKEDVIGLQASGMVNIVGKEVRGVQLAGLYNNNRGSVYGVQGSGFGNLVLDTLMGVQAAGFANVIKGSMLGVQASGFTNIATNQVDGVQAAGFLNVAGKEVNAVQAAGFLNYARGVNGVQAAGFCNFSLKSVNAVQAAGFMNLGPQINGTQVAGALNIGWKKVNGAQIAGLMNIAKEVNGIQIGLINIADTLSGVAIGLLNFSAKGYHKIQLSTGDLNHLELSFKTGHKRLYNILLAGARYPDVSEQSIYSLGYGLGTTIRPKSKSFVQVELMAQGFTSGNAATAPLLQHTYSLKWLLGWEKAKHFGFLLGPVFRFQVSDYYNAETEDFGLGYETKPWYSYQSGANNVKVYPGWQISVEF